MSRTELEHLFLRRGQPVLPGLQEEKNGQNQLFLVVSRIPHRKNAMGLSSRF